MTGEESICIFIAPQKMQRRRHQMMLQATKKKGFNISENLVSKVTHVVTDLDSLDQAERLLQLSAIKDNFIVISSSWITDCLKAGKVVPIKAAQMLKPNKESDTTAEEGQGDPSMPEYVCQRANPLHHHNKIFTDALEVLEKFADMRDEGSDYSRALAFRRGACTLKCLPKKVSDIKEIEGLPDIGGHVKRVVKEILDEGFCTEVEEIRQSEKFKTLKEFTGVYGVGPATAKKWMNLGFRSVYDVIDSDEVFDPRITEGLTYRHDLNSLVSKVEAVYIEDMVREVAESILPGVTVQVTGGFRRGKEMGHDVDLLITHPEDGMEKGILSQVIDKLTAKNIILHGGLEKSTYREEILSKRHDSKQTPKTTFDHFEKFIGIMRIPKISPTDETRQKRPKLEPYIGKGASGIRLDSCERDWAARRVDLIVVPQRQYYYALFGWTGSRQFNRSARLYALRKMNMKLTSHGLFDYSKGESIPADSEKEVFRNLQLTYREPSERNA
ncbi:DNA nucleotidylexotransferase-like [Lineus longissimus]|uniref:DNA nucleotidylexotransferase-like n=1 Tax=Lineus longissimus TaxID=88925 RepID=UPI002B4EFA6F